NSSLGTTRPIQELDQRGDALRNAIRTAGLEHAPHLLGGAVAPAAGAHQAREDQPGVKEDLVALVLFTLAREKETLGSVAQNLALVALELRRLELVENGENAAIGLV